MQNYEGIASLLKIYLWNHVSYLRQYKIRFGALHSQNFKVADNLLKLHLIIVL